MKLKSLWVAGLAFCTSLTAHADDVWQWSASVDSVALQNSTDHPRAFLWIAPECKKVRAVVVGQNNMIEEGILQHPDFRRELARLGIAEIYIAPTFDTWQSATNNDTANKIFFALLKQLAAESGYNELEFAPVIPIGHSAMASYPWNFAAWNPERTLAILSVHGDAPQTTLVGNGRPNVDWGGRNIDGIPGLMVMGEYEWWEDRLVPALKFRAAHPLAPIAMLAEPGNGHFNYCDDLVKFLALFIRKAAGQRLPAEFSPDRPPGLKPVDPAKGWLVERWQVNQPRTVSPAPFEKYTGDPQDAFWCFDREMALATQNYFADQPGKLSQLLGFVQDGRMVPQTETHQQVNLKFEPLADGVTFQLSAAFLDSVAGVSKNLSRWTYLPAGSPLGHATGGGPVNILRISGPVAQLSADTFAVRFNRSSIAADRRAGDIWLLASHPGDAKFKRAVQQALLKIPLQNNAGAEQHITFPAVPDVKAGTKTLKLKAVSDAGAQVYYFVREGPAEVDGDIVKFTKIPPRAKFPVKVTVVAWQYGRASEPKLKSAEPVVQTFSIVK
jgi:hypothetical protein